jgi:hypothetical protein
MSLIYCRECGKQISSNAETCPQCGAPQKNKKKNLMPWIIIILVLIIAYVGYQRYFPSLKSKPTDEIEQKKIIANEILGKDCSFVSQVSAEYIKSGLLADIVNTVVSNRCDCAKEILIPEIINNYSLEELEKLKISPAHCIQEIGKLVSENADRISQHCFTIK